MRTSSFSPSWIVYFFLTWWFFAISETHTNRTVLQIPNRTISIRLDMSKVVNTKKKKKKKLQRLLGFEEMERERERICLFGVCWDRWLWPPILAEALSSPTKKPLIFETVEEREREFQSVAGTLDLLGRFWAFLGPEWQSLQTGLPWNILGFKKKKEKKERKKRGQLRPKKREKIWSHATFKASYILTQKKKISYIQICNWYYYYILYHFFIIKLLRYPLLSSFFSFVKKIYMGAIWSSSLLKKWHALQSGIFQNKLSMSDIF